MNQDAALGQVQSSTGFSHLALNHLYYWECQLRVACDFKVIANGDDPAVRRHQRKNCSATSFSAASRRMDSKTSKVLTALPPHCARFPLNEYDVHNKEAESPGHSPIRRKVTYEGPACGPP